MPILPSRSPEIQKLAAGLGRGLAADRESAVARLSLQGERAVPALLAVLKDGTSAARLDALAVIERNPSASARAAVRARVQDPDPAVACRAVEVSVRYPDAETVAALRDLAASGPGHLRPVALESLLSLLDEGVLEAMDPLLERLLAPREDEALRRLAARALRHLSPRERAPILKRLRERTHDEETFRIVEGDASAVGPSPAAASTKELRQTIERLRREGTPAAITALHALLERLPATQRARPRPDDAVAEARGRIHQALAGLGSRIALYDLRESLAVRPVRAPSLLLSAAAVVGDASLLPTLAALAALEPPVHDLCAAAVKAIVQRERLRRTSATLKAVRPEHRAALDRLWPRPTGSARRRKT